mmetsp:Transcript_96699/g.252080  ORF Transcript_96699/g.252080 Transcript_96699/m.252080 type:complete len:355 (+) Transcript_96699:872-1936(+)
MSPKRTSSLTSMRLSPSNNCKVNSWLGTFSSAAARPRRTAPDQARRAGSAPKRRPALELMRASTAALEPNHMSWVSSPALVNSLAKGLYTGSPPETPAVVVVASTARGGTAPGRCWKAAWPSASAATPLEALCGGEARTATAAGAAGMAADTEASRRHQRRRWKVSLGSKLLAPVLSTTCPPTGRAANSSVPSSTRAPPSPCWSIHSGRPVKLRTLKACPSCQSSKCSPLMKGKQSFTMHCLCRSACAVLPTTKRPPQPTGIEIWRCWAGTSFAQAPRSSRTNDEVPNALWLGIGMPPPMLFGVRAFFVSDRVMSISSSSSLSATHWASAAARGPSSIGAIAATSGRFWAADPR